MSEIGEVQVLTSRVSGVATAYVLTEQLATCQRFEADMVALKGAIQDEFDSEGLDAIVDACKQIRSKYRDHLIVRTWCPASSPIPAVVIPWLWKALIVVLAFAAIMTIAYVGTYAFRELIWPAPKFRCSACGAGPFSSMAELVAHRTQEHPELPTYQCPYCGQAFETPEELNAHVEECPWKPAGVPEWLPWLIGGIAAVGITIGVVIIAPEVIKRLPKG